MAYPQITASSVSVEGNYTTNHDGLIPAGTEAGDLLIALTSNYTGDTGTFPGGWTQIFTQHSGGSHRLEAWYKIAGADEADFIWTTPGDRRSVTMVLRITDWHGTTAPEGASAAGSSATPDPPNLVATWGNADNLWIAAFAQGAQAPSVYPYADNQATQYSGGIGGAGAQLSRCSDEITAASENPGTFTIATGTNWAAGTIVVRPMAAAGPPGVKTALDVAAVSIKTYEDILVANVKTVNDVA